MTIIKDSNINTSTLNNHDHTTVGNCIPVGGGGTGATNVTDARNNLNIPSNNMMYTHDHTTVGGTIPIENGGTNATNSTDALINLESATKLILDNHDHTEVGASIPVAGGGTGVTTLSELASVLGLPNEYGTWTPDITFTNGATYSCTKDGRGYYHKVGRLVHIAWKCRLFIPASSTSWLSKNDYPEISNIPYINGNQDVWFGLMCQAIIPGKSNSHNQAYFAYMNAGGATVRIAQQGGANLLLQQSYNGGTLYLDGAISYVTN